MDFAVENLTVTDAAGVRRLIDVSMVAAAGQLVAIAGPPGPEKATCLRALSGSLAPECVVAGRILVEGEDLTRSPLTEWTRRGIRFFSVEGRRIDPKQSVERHLREAARRAGSRVAAPDRWVGEVLADFPTLKRQRDIVAANLSHGEQTLLGLAFLLAARPRLLAIEQPAADVSPFNLPDVFAAFRRYARENHAIVVCSEENCPALLRGADQILILQQGRLAFSGSREDLRSNAQARARLGLDRPRARFARPRRIRAKPSEPLS